MKSYKKIRINELKKAFGKDKIEEQKDDINSEEYWDALAENDEISVAEAAFMHGYLNA